MTRLFVPPWPANLFAWQVRSLSERFFIVCGFGQSARLLAKALDSMGLRVVVIEMDADREARIVIENLGSPAISLCADARFPDTLRDAGIHHPMCAGLLAMTSEGQRQPDHRHWGSHTRTQPAGDRASQKPYCTNQYPGVWRHRSHQPL
jgi:hypothetical protein